MRGIAILGGLTAIVVLVEPYGLLVIGAVVCFYARRGWRELLPEDGDA